MRYTKTFSWHLYLILFLVAFSCSRESESDCDQVVNCQINDIPTGNLYQISITESDCYFLAGSYITVYMNSDTYNFGQAKEITLFNNDNKVHVFGNWLVLNNNNRTFQIPSDIAPSDCYNIRVSKEGSTVANDDDETYISEPFKVVLQ